MNALAIVLGRRRLGPGAAARQISFALFVVFVLWPPQASAWDSRTHELITRLAVQALPPGPLKLLFTANERLLERLAVEPDGRLKKLYGDEEGRRHYIDGEDYGGPPFSGLEANYDRAVKRYGARTVARGGTLPWTIEEFAARLRQAAAGGDCSRFLRDAGYLSHYIGDATQPLHTTRHFDGYRGDRGVHARFELDADREAADLQRLAQPALQLRPLDSVWAPVMMELDHSNSLIGAVLAADRAARADRDAGAVSYDDKMRTAEPLIASQIARASSLLASIWFYEWRAGGEHLPHCAAEP